MCSVLVLLSIFCVISVWTCGYDSCPDNNVDEINVHLVAHSHDDVGWIKTVDDYFIDDVKSILTTVINALLKYPERRFVQAESVYLHKWWLLQNETTKNDVKKLLKSGQLEIVGGAWSMNDEATTHYQSIIDQFTLGLKFLNDTFEACGLPKIGWQIDPFGHSSEMASIFKQMNYDGLFLGRIHYQDRINRIKNKDMEFLWKDNSTGLRLFTSVLYNLYVAPDVIAHNNLCIDPYYFDMIFDVEDFIEYVETLLDIYKTNNILIPVGGDFHFRNAEGCFSNIDDVIRSMKGQLINNLKLNVFYSTPSCYLKAVHEFSMKNNIVFKTFTEDFFPYANKRFSYWTGFYTSRPALKRLERKGNQILQMSKHIHSMFSTSEYNNTNLESLKMIMGVFQHHDAITGTAREFVAKDYVQQLEKAISANIKSISVLISHVLKLNYDILFNYCPLRSFNICKFSSNSSRFLITIYNPLPWYTNNVVYIPVNAANYTVTVMHNSTLIDRQIQPNTNMYNESANYSLIFLAENVPAMGFKTFEIKIGLGETITRQILGNQSQHIGNNRTGVTLDKFGFVSSIKLNWINLEMKQNILYYEGYASDMLESVSSGPYIFKSIVQPKGFFKLKKLAVYKGELIDEIKQEFNSWIKQNIKVYKEMDFIEFEWTIGPIPADVGKEVIARYSTPLNSGQVFYTDVNGRGEIRRIWRKKKERVSGNYYPVASRISLKDVARDLKFTVYTDRPQGGTSLRSGQLELMLHRITLVDDGLGVGEPLLDLKRDSGGIVVGKHILTLTKINENYFNPASSFIELISLKDTSSLPPLEFSALNRNFPKDVYLLTMEPWEHNAILIRLEYKDNGFRTISIDLQGIFKFFSLESLSEVTLSGQYAPKYKLNYSWNAFNDTFSRNSSINKFIVSLKPMHIRTFIARVQYNFN